MEDRKRRHRVEQLMRELNRLTDSNYDEDDRPTIRYACPICGQAIGCPNCGKIHASGVSTASQLYHFLDHTDEELEAVWLSIYMQQGMESSV